MALKKEVTDKLKSVYKLDVDKLIAAITAKEDQDYELPDVTVFTPDELTARDNNSKSEGQKAAESAVIKTVVKEISTKLNIDVKGERIADLVTNVKEQLSKSNDEKVTQLTQQVTALQTDKQNLESSIQEIKLKNDQIAFDNSLIKLFPANRGADLSDEERLTLIKANVQFETVDGKVVAKKNGELLLDDKTRNPLDLSAVVTKIFTEKPILLGTQQAGGSGGAGGRGSGDNFAGKGAAGIKSFSQAQKQWLEQNPDKNVVSPEFENYLAGVTKDNPDFDFNA
jgi:hypothetical protein